MKEQNDAFELRSEEVQEILTRMPHWLIRWGSVMIFAIIMLFIFISWIVKYPDIVPSQILITTNVPPQKLIAKTTGRIEAILVSNKSSVEKNTAIAIVENSAAYKDVFLLQSIIDTINIQKSRFPFHLFLNKQLGDVEGSFALFQREYAANDMNLKLRPFTVENLAINSKSNELNDRLELMENQKTINLSELKLKQQELDRHESLYKKGIISTQDLENKKIMYLQAQKNYQNLLSDISALKSASSELMYNNMSTKINESKENSNLERNVIQSFYAVKNAVKDWELNYVLRSSIKGQITYLQANENQIVTAGDNLFAIVPTNHTSFIGKAKIPPQNSGKVKVGQKVNIRLANYDDSEFGTIEGKVRTISLTPDKDGNLLIDVELPKGMLTSYNKKITFRQEMSGTGDVITKDSRLIERFFYQFKGVFNR